MKTAFLIDGAFFLRRLRSIAGDRSPVEAAAILHKMCRDHLKIQRRRSTALYRILVYDCAPLSKKVHHPLTGRCIDYSRTPLYRWRTDFHEELKRMRKVALRLGKLEAKGVWALQESRLKEILRKQFDAKDLDERDIDYSVKQKGVDMKIGLDIAMLAMKRLVDQIILVSGDSDFVPAAKIARREGIDFILDPMYAGIAHDLHEHIDGIQSTLARGSQDVKSTDSDSPPRN